MNIIRIIYPIKLILGSKKISDIPKFPKFALWFKSKVFTCPQMITINIKVKMDVKSIYFKI